MCKLGVIFLVCILILVFSSADIEGFEPVEMSAKNRQILNQDPDKIYDPVYANIYYQVYVKYSQERIKYEIKLNKWPQNIYQISTK